VIDGEKLVAEVKATLVGLTDITGVMGSFVVTESGVLVATDLPSAFDATVFKEVGPRLSRLFDASASLGEHSRSCVFRFAEHKVYVKPMGDSMIGVLFGLQTSVPALKVAANLVARRVSALLAQPAPGRPPSVPPPPLSGRPPSVPPPPPSFSQPQTQPSAGAGAHAAAPEPARRTVRFRGRELE
jgi:hypothetical protein